MNPIATRAWTSVLRAGSPTYNLRMYAVPMLFVRGVIFSFLVPGVVGFVVPAVLCNGCTSALGWRALGWMPVLIGAAIYGSCLLRFLGAGGTPAIFFTRHLKFAIGEEPPRLVREGLYRFSRNPMYLGVLLAVFGQAIAFASTPIMLYGIALGLLFHFAVV